MKLDLSYLFLPTNMIKTVLGLERCDVRWVKTWDGDGITSLMLPIYFLFNQNVKFNLTLYDKLDSSRRNPRLKRLYLSLKGNSISQPTMRDPKYTRRIIIMQFHSCYAHMKCCGKLDRQSSTAQRLCFKSLHNLIPVNSSCSTSSEKSLSQKPNLSH